MKVIGLTDNFQGSAPSGTANGFPGIFLMADSTLLKDGKPFFVPDFSADMVARPTFAIHMNRLGKNIAAKFANRSEANIRAVLCGRIETSGKDENGKGYHWRYVNESKNTNLKKCAP